MAVDTLYLVKLGEIILKLGNRKEFEDRLKADLKRRLGGALKRLELSHGRIALEVELERAAFVEAALARTPGINGFARAIRTEKQPEAVLAAALDIARAEVAQGKRAFKAESRRADKSFPLDSYGLSSEIGHLVLENCPGTRVDLHAPQFTIHAEIRDKAYVYASPIQGIRGLPTGSQGRGLLLLSGGIDSPVAGYLMARRGLALDAVYFHAYPYTSAEAQEKVIALARVLAGYTGGLSLYTIPFTATQMRIKQKAREESTTLMMRAAMMELAERLAFKIGANSLVTGESLGQVASQTAENLRFTNSRVKLPVFRPLVGLDKEETIELARKIGSYNISVLPYEDCCVLFSPKHPILRADMTRESGAYEELELGPLLDEALKGAERKAIPFSVPGF